MTSLRDARAAALTRWHRDLGDNFTRALPQLLDDLERIDQQAMGRYRYKVGGIIYESADVTILDPGEGFRELQAANPAIGTRVKPEAVTAPTDADLAAWVERNPKAFADWAARQAQAAKPAPARRRTAR